MSTLSLDVKYEKHICKQLLEISRVVYIAEADDNLPTVSEVMRTRENATPEQVRKQIQDNLDFLSVNTKYMLFDREALGREITKLKKAKGR